MPYGQKFVLYVIVVFVITFFIAWLLGPFGRVVNVIFSFVAGCVAVRIAGRILT
jgi:hypothetical protein